MGLPLNVIKISIIFDHSSLYFFFVCYIFLVLNILWERAGCPEVSIITV
jgi:hypothetical protein